MVLLREKPQPLTPLRPSMTLADSNRQNWQSLKSGNQCYMNCSATNSVSLAPHRTVPHSITTPSYARQRHRVFYRHGKVNSSRLQPLVQLIDTDMLLPQTQFMLGQITRQQRARVTVNEKTLLNKCNDMYISHYMKVWQDLCHTSHGCSCYYWLVSYQNSPVGYRLATNLSIPGTY